MASKFRIPTTILLGLATAWLASCGHSNEVQRLSVSLSGDEVYKYSTLSGDEDGARIATQAYHYLTSEIRRDSTTRWDAVYFYKPTPGFVGSDDVILELLEGAIGGTEPTKSSLVAIHFEVH